MNLSPRTSPDALAAEMRAMSSIGPLLRDLPDDAARLRVLHWAAEYCGLQLSSETGTKPVADPDFELGSFEDLVRCANENLQRSA